MSILDLFRRKVELKDYLRNTKKIRVNGVQFEIRSVNMDDHLAGLNVILSMHKLYKERKKGTPNDPGKVAEDNAKLSKFIRDFVYAGVVSPQLTMKKDGEDGAIHVDEITANGELAQKLCAAILEYSYGKKKIEPALVAVHCALEFDALARRYGCRPSDLLKSSLQDYQFDLFIAGVAAEEARKQPSPPTSRPRA